MVCPNLFTSVWPRDNRYSAEFDVPTALSLNITVLWDVRPCLWASTCLRFDISYWLCLQNRGHGVDHPPPSSAEFKERVQPYLYSSSGLLCPVLGWNLPFTLSLYSRSSSRSSVGPLVEKQKDCHPSILRGLLAQGRSVSSQRSGIFRRQVLLTKHFHLYVALCCKQLRRKSFW